MTMFGVKGKLTLRYMGPFEITKRVCDDAYRLRLPLQLGHVNDIFHRSMIKKYTLDPSHVLPYAEIPL